MSDVKNAYDQIIDFLSNETEKTLLLRGIADKEKHQALLKALNAKGNLKGLINLIHTTKDGMENFFRWAELYKVNVPKKYGQGMKLSNLTIFFDNLTTKSNSEKYDNYAFDFMVIWPIQSVTKNEKEIQMLKEMAERQNTKKIIYLTIKEPWYNPDSLEPIVDRVIKLDCENDDPKEYQRILAAYEEDIKRRY
jgi:glycerophosphoryl diester phosphodiesterase